MSANRQLFINGKIFTSDSGRPYADAMAVENGRIMWIGPQAHFVQRRLLL